jgi:protein-S-isoprenylcysteine O-methyltransferase Ste14
MVRIIIFAIVSVFFVYVSRKSLFRFRSHGFWRFFGWESLSALVLLNALKWFSHPFSILQLVSWFLLLISILLIVHGVYLLQMVGKPDQKRLDDGLFAFEKTSSLVTVGAYKYIRHPLYSSLLFFTWGAFLKDPSWLGLILAFLTSLFLFLTAQNDESECLEHFGQTYQIYMQKTKRFLPFLF